MGGCQSPRTYAVRFTLLAGVSSDWLKKHFREQLVTMQETVKQEEEKASPKNARGQQTIVLADRCSICCVTYLKLKLATFAPTARFSRRANSFEQSF